MKHTFVFIDKLIILLKFVPRSLDNEDDKVKAKKSLALIEEYAHILRNLIESHKTRKYLARLHQTHIKKIENWTEQVAATFKKMDSLLAVLDEDIKTLASVIKNNPSKWLSVVSDMAFSMVMTGLHNEEEDLKRLRNLAIFEKQELEELIDHKKHSEGLHFWQSIAGLSEDEQIVEHEKYFVGLLS